MTQVENQSTFIQKALNHSQRCLEAVKCEMSFLGFIRTAGRKHFFLFIFYFFLKCIPSHPSFPIDNVLKPSHCKK